jgi:hypothetical protein
LKAEGFFNKVAVIAFVVVASGHELDVFLNRGISIVDFVIDIFLGFFDREIYEISL